MKHLNRVLSFILVVVLAMSIVSVSVADGKQYVIGIAEAQANDEVTTRRAYLENYLGPHYNVRFIFSETLKDDAATKQFIENCIDAGCDAIIDMKSASGQMARLCEENDVVYVINGDYSNHPEFLEGEYPMFGGCTGANNAQVGTLFRDWLEKNASEDGSEGFLIATTMAPQGNSQHIEITRAILEGLQMKYGLTYTKTIEELIATSATANVENDKGILITLFPGSPNKDTWLPGLSPLLQSGKYGVFLSSGQTYDKSAQVVNEVEKAFGINIKIASVAALGTTLTTAFNTLDPSGDSSIDLAAVKSISCMTATMFAATLNMLNGKHDTACLNADGTVPRYTFGFIAIQSAEELAATGTWDNRETNSWIADYNFVDRMLADDVTPEKINEIMAEVDYEHITQWMSER